VRLAQEHGADLVLFEVQRDAGHAVRELDHLAGHHLFQAMHAGNAVAHADDRTDFGHIHGGVVVFNLLAQYARDFVCSDLSHASLPFRSSGGQPLAQHVEAAAHGAIVDF